MKLRNTIFVVVILTSVFSTGVYSETAPSAAAVSVKTFLGRWDLTLNAPDREYPSWLEIRQEDGPVRAQMVSHWGNARPLPKIELLNGTLTFISPKLKKRKTGRTTWCLREG